MQEHRDARWAVLLALLVAGNAAGAPLLEVATPLHDAGLVEEYFVRHAFVLENRGDESLRIRGVDAECVACTRVSLVSPEIAPGTSTVLIVRINLAEIEGEFTRSVTVLSTSEGGPVGLTIAGTAVRPYLVTPPTIHFAPPTAESTVTGSVRIARNRHDLPPLRQVKCDSDLFAARLSDTDADGEYVLTVATRPPLPDGHTDAVIEILAEDPSAPRALVQIKAFVKPRIDIRPSALQFAPVDRLQKRILFIRPGPAQELALLDASAPFDTITCELYAEPRRPYFRVYLTAHSLAQLEGKRGNVTLTVQKPGEAESRIAIPLFIGGTPGTGLPGIDAMGAAACEDERP